MDIFLKFNFKVGTFAGAGVDADVEGVGVEERGWDFFERSRAKESFFVESTVGWEICRRKS